MITFMKRFYQQQFRSQIIFCRKQYFHIGVKNEIPDVYPHLTMIQYQRYHTGCTDACMHVMDVLGACDERLLYQNPKTPISNELSFSLVLNYVLQDNFVKRLGYSSNAKALHSTTAFDLSYFTPTFILQHPVCSMVSALILPSRSNLNNVSKDKPRNQYHYRKLLSLL